MTAAQLCDIYAKISLRNAKRSSQLPIPALDSPIVSSAWSNYEHMSFYKDPTAIEVTLDTIDLPKIYLGVDKRESESSDDNKARLKDVDRRGGKKLGYEDHLVLETLQYFKNDFFKWMNKPPCPQCGLDGDNMESIGAGRLPSPGPHLISIVERYKCRDCNKEANFPRMNNPVSLLEYRTGRCGEWVNCFLLVLKSVLGPDSQLRYIWNYEDHVWCEYYSQSLGRWIHLDPCENSWDEPSLYCENWGKKMSWVIGVGEDYIVDLSLKYITKPEKQIPKSSVANEKTIDLAIRRMNGRLAEKVWEKLGSGTGSDAEAFTKFYDRYLVPKGKESMALNNQKSPVSESIEAPTQTTKGRQSGSSEWTASRGEDGKK